MGLIGPMNETRPMPEVSPLVKEWQANVSDMQTRNIKSLSELRALRDQVLVDLRAVEILIAQTAGADNGYVEPLSDKAVSVGMARG